MFYTNKTSVYLPVDDYYYLKGGDTTSGALRTALLKFDKKTGSPIFYKFFGYNENLLSVSYNIYKNKKGNLYVFGIFREIINNTMNKEFSPVLFECDTNGNMLNYKVYNDFGIEQYYNNSLQFNDSTYFIVVNYHPLGSSTSSAKKIKMYKLNGNGALVDSFYFNKWNGKFFNDAGISFINLFKTFVTVQSKNKEYSNTTV